MANESTPADPAAEQKPLVLVVDDEYGPRESIAFTLSGEFTVETADRAADAIARIRERPFAAVVMDIRMPEMDGVQLVRRIQQAPASAAAPSVIMVSAYGGFLVAREADVPARTHRSVEVAGVPTLAVGTPLKAYR